MSSEVEVLEESVSEKDFEHIQLFRGKITDLHKEMYQSVETAIYPVCYTATTANGEEDEIVVSFFRRKFTSSFLVSKKVTGVSPNGKEWTSWKNLVQLYLSIKPNKAGTQSLNIYGSMRRTSKWSMFKNITNDSVSLSHIVTPYFIDFINKEAEQMVASFTDEKDVIPAPEPVDYSVYTGNIPPLIKLRREIEEDQNKRFSYIRKLAYPMFRDLDLQQENAIYNRGITLGARSSTPMEYTKILFGKKNYRKDLVKAVSLCPNTATIFFARHFRNQVPVDWIVTFLNETRDVSLNSFDKERSKEMKRLLSLVDLKYRRRLLMDMVNFEKRRKAQAAKESNGANSIEVALRRHGRKYNFYHVVDTLTFLALLNDDEIKNLDFSDWKDLHDKVVSIDRERKHENRAIPETSLSKKIAELPVGDSIKIVLPKDTHTLLRWGTQMEHCIGSYAATAVRGTAVFVGFIKDGQMIGNAQFDVNTKRCVQIFGKRNSILPENDRASIARVFTKQNILPSDAFRNAYGFKG